MRNNIYIGLVHYPVYNKNSNIVATSVTNFDIHDISRTCRTYDIKKYFIITPVDAQKELTGRIINYWTEGDGIDFNKNRKEAFENTDMEDSIYTTIENIKKEEGEIPRIITTSAKIFPNSAVDIAPPSEISIFPPSFKWATYPLEASTKAAALKCR